MAYLVEAHRPALKDLIPPRELRKQKRDTNEGSGRCLNTLEGRGRGRGGKGRKERTAHIERVYAPVELLDADILHRASPLNAIEDHLLRLRRIVSAGFQETPVCAARRKRGRA